MKIIKESLERIIKEELNSVMNEEPTHDGSYEKSSEEFFDGQIWLPQGEEDRRDDKFALKVVDVLSNSVNIEFLGNGYKKFKVGETKMLTKDSLKKRYIERSVDGYGKYQHTLSLDEKKQTTTTTIKEIKKMKITKQKLQRIIKEELQTVLTQEGFMDSIKGAFGFGKEEPEAAPLQQPLYAEGGWLADVPRVTAGPGSSQEGGNRTISAKILRGREQSGLASPSEGFVHFYLTMHPGGESSITPREMAEFTEKLGNGGKLRIDANNSVELSKFLQYFRKSDT